MLQNRCQRKVNGTELGVILFRFTENLVLKSHSEELHKNSFLMDDISENIFNEEPNKLFSVKIPIREDYIWLSIRWRSGAWDGGVQNTNYSSRSVSLNLKDCSSWKIFTGQIELSEKVYLRSELEMEDRIHQECCARSCREIEIMRIRSYQEGNY